MPPEKLQWKELYQEVVTSGLCTGCAGCVIVCPHDVLGYNDENGIYKPFQFEEGSGPRQLQPRREGLHELHTGVPALPGVGAGDRRVHVRSDPRADRGRRASRRTSCSPGQPIPCSPKSARTAGSCRRSCSTRSRTTSSTPPSSRTWRVTGPPGRRSPASRAPKRTSSPRPGAATRTRPTRWRTTKRSRAEPSASRWSG